MDIQENYKVNFDAPGNSKTISLGDKIKSFEMFEYCQLCGKLYNLKSRKNHLKSSKHKKLLLQHNLTNLDIEISRYNLVEFKNEDENKSEESIIYLPVDF
jgi:hypothetical protein